MDSVTIKLLYVLSK